MHLFSILNCSLMSTVCDFGQVSRCDFTCLSKQAVFPYLVGSLIMMMSSALIGGFTARHCGDTDSRNKWLKLWELSHGAFGHLSVYVWALWRYPPTFCFLFKSHTKCHVAIIKNTHQHIVTTTPVSHSKIGSEEHTDQEPSFLVSGILLCRYKGT